MSLNRCNDCDAIVDTDDGDCYPYAMEPLAPPALQDLCICEDCQIERCERAQQELSENTP